MIVSAEEIMRNLRAAGGELPRRKSPPVPDGRIGARVIRHGTPSAYSNAGCRCKICRDAHTAEQRRRTERRRLDRERGLPLPRHVKHGTENAYTNWACRCDVCVTGRRERQRKI